MNRFCVRRNTIFFEILLVRDQVGYAPHFTESIPTHSDFYILVPTFGTDDVRLCVRNTLRYVFNYDFFVTTII